MFHSEPTNVVKYKVFWWIYNPMGSLKKFNLVVLWTTLSNCVNMQISAAITEISIFFNILDYALYHLKNCVYTYIFMVKKCCLMNTHIIMCMQIRTAIIEKPNFVNIWKTMHYNIMKLVSTYMFPWSRNIMLSLKML